MIKPIVIVCSFLIFIASCKPEEEWLPIEKPQSLVDSLTMVNILVDLNLLEAGQSLALLQPKDSLGVILPLYKQKYHDKIFVKYGTNKASFDSSFNYYMKKPDIMSRIYESSLQEISRVQAEVSK